MNDSISGSTRGATTRTGNRVIQSALGSPAQHARKNLLRKKRFKSSTPYEQSEAESKEVKGALDERGGQMTASARSLAAMVNQLQRATNLIGSAENALDNLVVESSAFSRSLMGGAADVGSPSGQSFSKSLKHLAGTLERTLMSPLADGKPLFSPNSARVLREILAKSDVDETICSDYARIVNQATLRLRQLGHALDTFSADLGLSEKALPLERIDHLLRGITAPLSKDREALSRLQDKLTATLRNSLIGEIDAVPRVAEATALSTHQALSERTRAQLLSRPGAAVIYDDVESGLVEALLRD